ncbi:transcription repressor OFP1-like [Ananas comosus]|uniref:Transcription repressor n=1 Tax=Ananas comosus TaxID=4615 RepID=A0A6P5G5V6_ANACO|nr:transcription repressor OFP1-like [Ananas comosus]
MGNYRFKLSDMIPNAWFYKLRDMGNRGSSSSRGRGYHHPKAEAPTTPQALLPTSPPLRNQTLLPSRASYYHSTLETQQQQQQQQQLHSIPAESHFPVDPPRKSARRARKKAILKPTSRPSLSPASASRRSRGEFEQDPIFALPRESDRYRVTSSATDITIDVDQNGSFTQQLSPILTKPPPKEALSKATSKAKLRRARTSARSPRAVRSGFSEKQGRRKTRDLGFSGSFAVVKSSWDPRKDFAESMVEMIVEKGISASGDLEELLACYLALNSEEYHAVIVKVFQQIWLDLKLCTY